jgi:phage tail sheath gpL-like
MANVHRGSRLVETVHSAVRTYRRRYDRLAAGSTDTSSLRKLQHEIVRTYVEAQRLFVAIQTGTLAQLRTESAPDANRRKRSLQLYEDVVALHDLMSLINVRLAMIERQRRS